MKTSPNVTKQHQEGTKREPREKSVFPVVSGREAVENGSRKQWGISPPLPRLRHSTAQLRKKTHGKKAIRPPARDGSAVEIVDLLEKEVLNIKQHFKSLFFGGQASMDVKQQLRQIQIIDCQVKNLLEERKAITFLKGAVLDGVHVQTSRGIDPPWMKSIEKWDDLTEVITRKADKLIRAKRVIIDRINSLQDERYIKLLTERYINYKTLEQAAEEMGYCNDHARRLHGKALKALSQIPG